MAGFEKGTGNLFADGHRAAIGNAFEGLEGMVRVGGGVKRFHPFQMEAFDVIADHLSVEPVLFFFQQPLDLLKIPLGCMAVFAGPHLGQGGAYRLVVQVFGVALLNVGRIWKQVATGIDRRPGTVDPSIESISGNQGDTTGVIDVGV